MNYDEDEDGGQVDGEWTGGGPMLMPSAPPWQLWGNTQRVSLAPNAFTNPGANNQNITLLRVAYKRPETWRFLFAAKMISGPGDINHQSNVSIWFELITGIGRSNIIIPFWVSLPEFRWDNAPGPPVGLVNWTQHAIESNVLQSFDNQTPQVSWQTSLYTDLVIGEDMTIVAHCSFTTNLVTTTPAVVEVSGQMAPNVHTRPDWNKDGAPHVKFMGAEIEGR